ncbi:MAG: S8 family serine peptidase, partial [Planctomycetota bacterium]|nr:S8 family serine peptidase [Planctomycetota bacterium]
MEPPDRRGATTTSSYQADSIAVGAVTPSLVRRVGSSSGSELGSSLFCAAPGEFMFTTSRLSPGSFDPAYKCIGGTSLAGPCVAGVIALMLDANPDLSWRDTYEAIVQTAATIDPGPGWHTNQAGNDHSYEYGHGLIDAFEAVHFVWDDPDDPNDPPWTPLLGERMIVVPVPTNGAVIGPGNEEEIPVSPVANMRIEHVELLMNVSTISQA